MHTKYKQTCCKESSAHLQALFHPYIARVTRVCWAIDVVSPTFNHGTKIKVEGVLVLTKWKIRRTDRQTTIKTKQKHF